MTEQPTALVTGANRGIGFAIVRALAQRGHRVWLGSRDAERGEEAVKALGREGLDVEWLQLDFADDASVAEAARTLGGRIDRLDALVNNAGIWRGVVRPSEEPIEDIRAIFDVNVFGAVRATQAFLPLLKASRAPRVVMVSSRLGALKAMSAFPEQPGVNLLGYAASKTALNMATVTLAKDLGPLGFKINACCPGLARTDLNDNTASRSPDEAARIAVHLATLAADGPNCGFFADGGRVEW